MQSCENCKYAKLKSTEEPCDTCQGENDAWSHWEQRSLFLRFLKRAKPILYVIVGFVVVALGIGALLGIMAWQAVRVYLVLAMLLY